MNTSDERFLYQTQFPIRWGDMDALGHVNNTVYFRYFEQARLEWFEQSGFGSSISEGQGMVIVDNHAEYLRPVVYPSKVTVDMYGHTPGNSSFISTYLLSVDGTVFTRGSAKVVWIDNTLGKSMVLPAVVRAMVSTEITNEPNT